VSAYVQWKRVVLLTGQLNDGNCDEMGKALEKAMPEYNVTLEEWVKSELNVPRRAKLNDMLAAMRTKSRGECSHTDQGTWRMSHTFSSISINSP
jgi:hypothetical protein